MTVLLLIGPTAIGKSQVAVLVAEAVGAEIVSADARAIYRGLRIGTDRPPNDILCRVPHHLIGVIDPKDRYDAARFRQDCEQIVAQILGRGRRAIIVGGSTLYVRALTRGLFPGPSADPSLRKELAARSLPELYAELKSVDPVSAARIHPTDSVRIIRALEVYHKTGKPISSFFGRDYPFPWPLVKVGLTLDRRELYRRIEARVERMFSVGLVQEARGLFEMGLPPDAPAARTIGYRELFSYFQGEISLEEAKRKIIQHTKAYARRQMSWFRTEPEITWINITGRSMASIAEEIKRIWFGN